MPESTLTSAPAAYLVPLAGPHLAPIELSARATGGLTVGRHEQCDICLPADAEKVSRMHARFVYDGARWHVSDLGSRWGTFVNGIRLTPNNDVPLNDGDLIRITPWTFTLSPTAKRRGVQSDDDSGAMHTMVRAVNPDAMRPLADTMLALLLESAAAIHAAMDEKQLADMIMDAAVRGTGLSNAAMLRPVDAAGHFEIIASRISPTAQAAAERAGAATSFSRSLINAASQGVVAELSGSGAMLGDISQSIVQLKINAAICVPLMLGQTVAAYLYLDSRGTLPQALRPNASAFCVALGRMASLALANLKRIDMEKRSEQIRMELAAAAMAQKWIMPKRQTRHGPFECTGESRPGQYVGGDFFDIIPLSETRLAVAVGDVSGKGISASVLMTATQGFLHGVLKEHGDAAHAVTDANNFVNPRRPENRFVTMWVGVFDAAAGTLNYVDAGHSYAMLKRADGTFQQLNEGTGLPIGVDTDAKYVGETVNVAPGDCVMIVSDGIIEQFGGPPGPGGFRAQFEVIGLQNSMSHATVDPVADLFNAVIQHAGTTQLSDDATAVLVRW
jgi:serine phosphatase RsbU (regulator of sigma subunit)